MNELRFLEVMGKIDEDLIKEAEIDIEQHKKIKQTRSRKNIYNFMSTAAAAVIAISTVTFLKVYKPEGNPGVDGSIIISDTTSGTTLTTQCADICVTTKADQTAVTAQNKVTTVSSTQTDNKQSKTSLSQTVQTTKKTSVQTTSTTTVVSAGKEPGTVTASTAVVPEKDYENEGSIIMKKYAAALTALMAVSSSIPAIPANAWVYEPEMIYEQEISSTALSTKEFIEEFNVDLDLNSDGKIDIFDVYAMSRCEWGYVGAVPDYIQKKYDAMPKEKVYEYDPEECDDIKLFYLRHPTFYFDRAKFAEYFLNYYDVKPEYFDPNYYIDNCPDEYNDILPNDLIKQEVGDIHEWTDDKLRKTGCYIKNEDGTFRPFTLDDIESAYRYNENEDCYEMNNDFCLDNMETSDLHLFIDDLKSSYNLIDILFGRDFIGELQDNGLIDCDVDSDGTYDFDDIVIIAYYLNTSGDVNDEEEKTDALYEAMTCPATSYSENYPVELRESPDNPITESEWNKARDFIDVATYYFNNKRLLVRNMTEQYLLKNVVDQKYFDPVYYEQNHFAHYVYDDECIFVDDRSKGLLFGNLGYYEGVSLQYGPDSEKYKQLLEEAEKFETYSDYDVNEAFPEYYKNVKTGILTEPDMDLDGKIGISDFIILNNIENSHIRAIGYEGFVPFTKRYPETQEKLNISQEAVDNYKNNFDFNNNGISCDLFEIYSMKTYVFGELLSQYEDDDAICSAIRKYKKEHPEIVYHRISAEKMAEFTKSNDVGFTPMPADEYEIETDDIMEDVETITSHSSFKQIYALPEGITGDANDDGTVDLSDAVLIMQFISNPSKYGVNGSDEKHITAKGYRSADVDGEGVTNMDALTIQKYLLGMCSI